MSRYRIRYGTYGTLGGDRLAATSPGYPLSVQCAGIHRWQSCVPRPVPAYRKRSRSCLLGWGGRFHLANPVAKGRRAAKVVETYGCARALGIQRVDGAHSLRAASALHDLLLGEGGAIREHENRPGWLGAGFEKRRSLPMPSECRRAERRGVAVVSSQPSCRAHGDDKERGRRLPASGIGIENWSAAVGRPVLPATCVDSIDLQILLSFRKPPPFRSRSMCRSATIRKFGYVKLIRAVRDPTKNGVRSGSIDRTAHVSTPVRDTGACPGHPARPDSPVETQGWRSKAWVTE